MMLGDLLLHATGPAWEGSYEVGDGPLEAPQPGYSSVLRIIRGIWSTGHLYNATMSDWVAWRRVGFRKRWKDNEILWSHKPAYNCARGGMESEKVSLPNVSVSVVSTTNDWWNFSRYFMEWLSSISYSYSEKMASHIYRMLKSSGCFCGIYSQVINAMQV
jgi:hypothetical protein